MLCRSKPQRVTRRKVGRENNQISHRRRLTVDEGREGEGQGRQKGLRGMHRSFATHREPIPQSDYAGGTRILGWRPVQRCKTMAEGRPSSGAGRRGSGRCRIGLKRCPARRNGRYFPARRSHGGLCITHVPRQGELKS